MFTANMINYQINEETKTITASVTGIENDAIDTILKYFSRNHLIFNDKSMCVEFTPDENGVYNEEDINVYDVSLISCRKFHLPSTFTAKAVYDPEDPHPFNVERGKQIARRRLYNMYNKAYFTACNNIMDAINKSMDDMNHVMRMAHDRIQNFKYFEYYDVFKMQDADSIKL